MINVSCYKIFILRNFLICFEINVSLIMFQNKYLNYYDLPSVLFFFVSLKIFFRSKSNVFYSMLGARDHEWKLCPWQHISGKCIKRSFVWKLFLFYHTENAFVQGTLLKYCCSVSFNTGRKNCNTSFPGLYKTVSSHLPHTNNSNQYIFAVTSGFLTALTSN